MGEFVFPWKQLRLIKICLNETSTTNLEEEEIVDSPGNDGNASMPKEVSRPNLWREMMMMMMMMMKPIIK